MNDEIQQCLASINQSLLKLHNSIGSYEKETSEHEDDFTISEDELSRTYLTPSTQFSSQWLNQFQCIPSISSLDISNELYDIPNFALRTEIKFFRRGLDARIIDFEQHSVTNSQDKSSKTSLSLTRQFNPKSSYNQANSESMPFAPGGLTLLSTDGKATETFLHRDKDGLYDTPPGFSRGLEIKEAVNSDEANSLRNEDDGRQVEPNEDYESRESPLDDELVDQLDETSISTENKFEIDALLPKQVSFGRTGISSSVPEKKVKQWAHMVDVNKTIEDFDELVPNPAKVFPFELDTFQKEAVSHLEQGDSVFVAAHTSAGKTVVAEYAIAMAQRNLTKCIYTSPIKALSNQKYRDFKKVYEDVGILTGDVQINPEASCLIMTTEILRSMLYRGADLIRDVEFVIFDEVHYVNDQDRGVVWEESIIMLPEHVKFVLLSATVPNTFEFADWIGRTKKKDIYVISTSKRPVPLEHYLWCKNSMYKIVDSKSNFIKSGWQACADASAGKKKEKPKQGENSEVAGRGGRGSARGTGARGSQSSSRGSSRGGFAPSRGGFNSGGPSSASNRFGARNPGQAMPSKTSLMQLCQYLAKNSKLPAVFFVFSQKRCQDYALALSSLDYCSAKEKSEIHMFIDKAVTRLKKEDRELPQILMARDILSRGIGIHHSGLLPIVKEVIEILFAKSLVKILFATETIAMGLNLPTKTVIYTGTRKNDGNHFRMLYPGEYTQMSGRAGRRGLDTTGTAIIMVNDSEPPSIQSLRAMMLEPPTKLHSQFKLTYSMILNLLRVEALKVEEMIKRSFSEHASQVLLPEHEESVKLNESILEKLKRSQCPICDIDIEKTHEQIMRVQELTHEIIRGLMKSLNGRRRIFAPGRVMIYNAGPNKESVAIGLLFCVSVPSNSFSVVRTGLLSPKKTASLPHLSEIATYKKEQLADIKLEMRTSPYIERAEIEDVKMIADDVYEHDMADIVKGRNTTLMKDLRKFLLRLLEDPNSKMVLPDLTNIKIGGFQLLIKEREELIAQIAASKTITCKNFPVIYSQVHEQYLIKEKIKSLKNLMSDQNLELLPDYEQRIAVLKDLGYLDESMNVLLKGRVACEISVGFELVITELLLDNFLGSYEPEEIVALMSVFVYEGGTKIEASTITHRLDEGKSRIAEIVKTVNSCFEKHQVQLTLDESEFLEKNRFGLMEAVYEWSRGMSFNDITKLTDVPEGKIVRVINRLDEVFRQVMTASNLMGDTSLHDKVGIAKESIKRDIVFCASLYL